jgi:hypothetical protein
MFLYIFLDVHVHVSKFAQGLLQGFCSLQLQYARMDSLRRDRANDANDGRAPPRNGGCFAAEYLSHLDESPGARK